eukprot:1181296-Prorocentrum_minimum.AAC.2
MGDQVQNGELAEQEPKDVELNEGDSQAQNNTEPKDVEDTEGGSQEITLEPPLRVHMGDQVQNGELAEQEPKEVELAEGDSQAQNSTEPKDVELPEGESQAQNSTEPKDVELSEGESQARNSTELTIEERQKAQAAEAERIRAARRKALEGRVSLGKGINELAAGAEGEHVAKTHVLK